MSKNIDPNEKAAAVEQPTEIKLPLVMLNNIYVFFGKLPAEQTEIIRFELRNLVYVQTGKDFNEAVSEEVKRLNLQMQPL